MVFFHYIEKDKYSYKVLEIFLRKNNLETVKKVTVMNEGNIIFTKWKFCFSAKT